MEMLRTKPTTPEEVTDYWKGVFSEAEDRTGIQVVVPNCDLSSEEIQRSMLAYEGHEIAGIIVPRVPKLSVSSLRLIYPSMGGALSHDKIRDAAKFSVTGWLKVYEEASGFGRYKDSISYFAREQGYHLAKMDEYVLGAQVYRDFHGRYPDMPPAWIQLGDPAIYRNGTYPQAGFDPDGSFRTRLAIPFNVKLGYRLVASM